MTDRRERKTITSLKRAYAELLKEKDIKNITIKDLCEKADINKSTFYLHYKDIYDFANSISNELIDGFIKVIAPYSFIDLINNLPEIFTITIDYFEKNKDLYLPYLKSPSLSPYLNNFKDQIINIILRKATSTENNNLIYVTSVTFIINGIIGVLEQTSSDNLSVEVLNTLAKKIQSGFL